ncbi:MAG: hypothetical protein ACTSSE_12295 [Candidatus Thorarchaeota archaeon]
MEIQKIGNDVTELNFDPITEGWNVYKLSDGSTLNIRPIIFKVYHTHQLTIEGAPILGFAASNIVSARVPDILKKTPITEGEPPSEERIPVDFNVIREIWNEFDVEGGFKLKVKLVVSRVVRSSKVNPFGEPIYIVSSGNVADVQAPREDTS